MKPCAGGRAYADMSTASSEKAADIAALRGLPSVQRPLRSMAVRTVAGVHLISWMCPSVPR
jgi:hypothetical protein